MPEEPKRAKVLFTLNVGMTIRTSTKKKWKQIGVIIQLPSGNMVGNIDTIPILWFKQMQNLESIQFSVFPAKEAAAPEPEAQEATDTTDVSEAPF